MELQQTHQSKSRIIQPPPGLESFADRFQQGIDEDLIARRQLEVDRINALVASHSDVVAAEEERRRALEQKRVTAVQETEKILKNFRVEEKLRHINSSVWGNRGQISAFDDYLIIRDNPNIQGGLDLSYFYPASARESQYRYDKNGKKVAERYRRVLERKPSSLLVLAIKDRRTADKYIEVRSLLPYKPSLGFEEGGNRPLPEPNLSLSWCTIAKIPVESIDSEMLFDNALAKETSMRTQDGLPDQLEKAGETALRRLDWGWSRWFSTYTDLGGLH